MVENTGAERCFFPAAPNTAGGGEEGKRRKNAAVTMSHRRKTRLSVRRKATRDRLYAGAYGEVIP